MTHPKAAQLNNTTWFINRPITNHNWSILIYIFFQFEEKGNTSNSIHKIDKTWYQVSEKKDFWIICTQQKYVFNKWLRPHMYHVSLKG